ncbi:MAG: hypothetical protein KIT80_11705 [Chitinophagaceae bacterium]|nr:hypothetical protein [Chitinophagaceae bacterium]MCW5927567.1 hypothetical protein [Chitinophagaceae bacterium]
MKLKIFVSAAVAWLLIATTGCYKDVYYPDFDPNAPISFSADLQPILSKSCASSGCHDDVPAHKPALTPDKAYNALKSGGFIDLNVPENSILYRVMKSGEMPPTGALKSTDVQKVLYWIKNGAPNN